MNKEHCFFDRIDGDYLDSQEDFYDFHLTQITMLERFMDNDCGLYNWITEKDRERIQNLIWQNFYKDSDRDFLNGLKKEYLQYKQITTGKK